jgi:hypothetical protein
MDHDADRCPQCGENIHQPRKWNRIRTWGLISGAALAVPLAYYFAPHAHGAGMITILGIAKSLFRSAIIGMAVSVPAWPAFIRVSRKAGHQVRLR